MSWILFDRSSRRIQLFAGNQAETLVSRSLGVWPAHNDTAQSSNGSWPVGTYRWSHYNAHTTDQDGFGPGCFSTAYGCNGIHVFIVSGRPGMGIHSGRVKLARFPSGVGGRTLGCLRTSDTAMAEINRIHAKDPIVAVVVR